MNGKPSQFYLIGNALSGAEQNHRVISQNIANANTPDFQTRQLAFGKFMDGIESGKGDEAILPQMKIELVQGLNERLDGNNVDIDRQLVDLKENALMYQTYSQLLAAKMATIRKAVTG